GPATAARSSHFRLSMVVFRRAGPSPARLHALVSPTVDAPQIPAPEPQPDPRLGTPGPYGRVGRAPAGRQRPGHRTVQAPERAGQRRAGSGGNARRRVSG